ncbi:hypothetical protein BV25DRAFT_238211 [Artomyces pyxidatus]|uniref:Uncharacterized protein n=1 Tax=Artomyces pyxidatus TaxID=48021 RepID=A0ACB8T8Z9_9AGAM|nr:hypothetical protein BV25DRAFT_238211 [Artomyces pyxidatus]
MSGSFLTEGSSRARPHGGTILHSSTSETRFHRVDLFPPLPHARSTLAAAPSSSQSCERAAIRSRTLWEITGGRTSALLYFFAVCRRRRRRRRRVAADMLLSRYPLRCACCAHAFGLRSRPLHHAGVPEPERSPARDKTELRLAIQQSNLCICDKHRQRVSVDEFAGIALNGSIFPLSAYPNGRGPDENTLFLPSTLTNLYHCLSWFGQGKYPNGILTPLWTLAIQFVPPTTSDALYGPRHDIFNNLWAGSHLVTFLLSWSIAYTLLQEITKSHFGKESTRLLWHKALSWWEPKTSFSDLELKRITCLQGCSNNFLLEPLPVIVISSQPTRRSAMAVFRRQS